MKSVKNDKTYYFQCDCSSQEHTFGVEFDVENKEVSMHMQLVKHPSIFKRIVVAVKYIFGYTTRFGGHWDLAIMNEERFMDFYNIMSRYVYTAGFTNKAAIKIKHALNDLKDGKKNSMVPNGNHYLADKTKKYKKV